MRILVIGGTGFIGTFLVPQLLDARHDVAVLQRPESTKLLPEGARPIRGNRHDLAAAASMLRAFAPEVVVDLILSSGRQAAALMDVFRGHAARVVVASSIDVYRAMDVVHRKEEGPLEPVPLREDSALRSTLHPYPEEMVMLKRMDDLRPVIVLPRRFASWRSPRGYVENVAAAIALASTSEAASERAAGRVYNVAEAESFSELEWARMLADATGWGGEFLVVEDEEAPHSVRTVENLEQHLSADTTRIRSEHGYREPVDRAEAISRTIAWERANPPARIDPARFDYPAEDEAARRAGARVRASKY